MIRQRSHHLRPLKTTVFQRGLGQATSLHLSLHELSPGHWALVHGTPSFVLGPDEQSPGRGLLTVEGRRRKERVRQRLNHQFGLHCSCFSVLLLPVSVTELLFPRTPQGISQHQQLPMRRQELSFSGAYNSTCPALCRPQLFLGPNEIKDLFLNGHVPLLELFFRK